jgi:hypothetical protein
MLFYLFTWEKNLHGQVSTQPESQLRTSSTGFGICLLGSQDSTQCCRVVISLRRQQPAWLANYLIRTKAIRCDGDAEFANSDGFQVWCHKHQVVFHPVASTRSCSTPSLRTIIPCKGTSRTMPHVLGGPHHLCSRPSRHLLRRPTTISKVLFDTGCADYLDERAHIPVDEAAESEPSVAGL